MINATSLLPKIVSRAEWLAARRALLQQEKELTRQRDRLAEERRRLPWVKVEKDYRFDLPGGRATLGDLFAGRSQLFVYHFMFGPDWEEGCPSCSLLMDHVEGARMHFEHRDLSFAAISRAALSKIEAFKRRLGWTFPWASSAGSDFNRDFGVTFSADEVAGEKTIYNFGTIQAFMTDLPGASIFARGEDGQIYHTYSTYARGLETLIGAFAYMDLTPRGRNEGEVMDWIRHHDRYDDLAGSTCGCRGEDAR